MTVAVERDYDLVLTYLQSLKNPRNVAGMARFGISTQRALGVPKPLIRKLAKELGKRHNLALKLWKSGIHEARIVASLVADPDRVTQQLMDRWARDFDSWDICDQCCMNLFNRTPFAYSKANEWSGRKEEFVKRAGFALMASLALHDKKAPDKKFVAFFPLILKGATDERNFVKKAVNWALRQIGKRNAKLQKQAIQTALKMQKIDSKSARWIASDALRELRRRSPRKNMN